MITAKGSTLSNFLSDESGTALIEYALLTGIVTVIAIASMVEIGDSTAGFLDSAASALE